MRRTFWLLIGGCLLAQSSQMLAQERQIGLKGGASIATLHETSGVNGPVPLDPRTGLTGGAFIVLPVRGRFAFQGEMLLTHRGATEQFNDPTIGEGAALRLRLHYLDVPLLARIDGPRFRAARLHIFGGPVVSLRLSANQRLAFTGIGAIGFENDIADDVRRFDFALGVGAGADIGRLVFEGRYTHGLIRALTDVFGNTLENRGLAVTVGGRIF